MFDICIKSDNGISFESYEDFDKYYESCINDMLPFTSVKEECNNDNP